MQGEIFLQLYQNEHESVKEVREKGKSLLKLTGKNSWIENLIPLPTGASFNNTTTTNNNNNNTTNNNNNNNNNNNFINLLKKAFQLDLQCQISKT